MMMLMMMMMMIIIDDDDNNDDFDDDDDVDDDDVYDVVCIQPYSLILSGPILMKYYYRIKNNH